VGVSDNIIYYNLFHPVIEPKGATALLGFSDNTKFEGDLYDLQLGNWNINSDWTLNKKYETIICLRVAYFAEKPKEFLKRCYNSLEDGGYLYVDWAMGDHWRDPPFDFKIGWFKNGEHEYAYEEGNYLWSGFFDRALYTTLYNTSKAFAYFRSCLPKKYKIDTIEELEKILVEEVPSLISFEDMTEYFEVELVNDFSIRGQLGLPAYYLLFKLKKRRKQ